MSFTSPEPPDEPATPKLGRPDNPLPLTDADAMRALAHPARIALLQHLALEGARTATECAPVVGLSPSACSYHLRQLARYGFVAQDRGAAANGRERPWRAEVISTRFEHSEDPVVSMAGELLRRTMEDYGQDVRRRYHAREADYPPEWRAAAGATNSVVYVTADELASLQDRVRAVCREFVRLSGDDRPGGSQPVQVVLDFTPMFPPPGSAGS
ncbi:MAG TPA: helix-turn-helix domain-containing protein [Streptosporangiaceae bacterium]|jgi:predicted ArsR family transcriptional regulator